MKKLNRDTSNYISRRPIKVLQFGKGNFLRGFADWVIDILNEKTDFNGDIQIIESNDNGLAAKINRQEGLYHVLLEGLQNGKKLQQIRIVKSVRGVFNPNDDYKAFLKMGKNPDLEFIISNTTEAGIIFDPNDIDYDTLPNSFPGRLTAFLYYRFLHFKEANNKKLIVLPCELIDYNGDTLKEIILRYANLWKLPGRFKIWLDDHTMFCNTLVDRIVTGFPRDRIVEIQENIGFTDDMVVTAEPYHSWIIEDQGNVKNVFPVEKAGLEVRFVTNLSIYKTRKVRILNGAHTAIATYGYLKGLETVNEIFDNPKIEHFIRQLIFDEIIPTIDLPEEELRIYANSVIERFKNPFIKHKLLNISLNSIAKFKVRVVPSLLSYYERKNKLPEGIISSFAHLIVFYRGHFNEKRIPLQDDKAIIDFFAILWETSDINYIVNQVLSNTAFWEMDLTKIYGLQKQIIAEIQEILKTEIITNTK